MRPMTRVQQCRHVLLAVAELHASGYERARVAPRIADNPCGGVWKCEIVPVSVISRKHGAIIGERGTCVPGREFPFYSSSHWRYYYRVVGDSPKEYAEHLLAAFPQLAEQSLGSDTEYAQWYREMLRMTEPEGIVFAHAWHDCYERPALDCMPVFNAGEEVTVPLPPPGQA
jgi:hypothetical protein